MMMHGATGRHAHAHDANLASWLLASLAPPQSMGPGMHDDGSALVLLSRPHSGRRPPQRDERIHLLRSVEEAVDDSDSQSFCPSSC